MLTLVKQKPRLEIMLKIDLQDQSKVDQAENIFKTITSDNGSEFAGIYELLTDITDVFFAHPYASHERGTKENQHKVVRRFIPKGESLKEIPTKTINRIDRWMNNIPRKILGYQTATKAFLKELKLFVS